MARNLGILEGQPIVLSVENGLGARPAQKSMPLLSYLLSVIFQDHIARKSANGPMRPALGLKIFDALA